MDLLSDPLNDRVATQVKPPPHRPLNPKYIFSVPGSKYKIDWQLMKTVLFSIKLQIFKAFGFRRKNHQIRFNQNNLRGKQNILLYFQYFNSKFFPPVSETNLIRIQDPVTIVGDLHGQFYDLLKLLELGGNPEETQYLFLGDLVDRGNFSIETAILVYTLKIDFPKTVTLLRGNHECREMTSFFNFREECLLKYDQEIYEIFMDSFDKLPLACIVNQQMFASHGGISPELTVVDWVDKVYRFCEPPKTGIFCDLLWSDPNPKEVQMLPQFVQNNTRGCSYFYSIEAAANFLNRNNLLSIVRGHEVQLEGYKMHDWNQQKQFPSIITIFSAPNYCDAYNNKGAIIKFKVKTNNKFMNLKDNNFTILQYACSPHPYLLPNFMNIFTWSIPFVLEKVASILECIARPQEDSYDEMNEKQYDKLIQSHEDQSIKSSVSSLDAESIILQQQLHFTEKKQFQEKIKSIAKIKKKNSILRERNEQLMQLSGNAPDSKIPKSLLFNRQQSQEGKYI